MTKTENKRKFSKSVRKHIRKQKSFIRKQTLTQDEYKKKVEELYKKFV